MGIIDLLGGLAGCPAPDVTLNAGEKGRETSFSSSCPDRLGVVGDCFEGLGM